MALRIAHVTATFPPYTGGTGNVCYHNARELARRGHEVHVFTGLRPDTAIREEHEGFTIRRLRAWLQIGNASVSPDLVRSLRGFDVIHLHYPCIPNAELARLAAAIHRVPLVVSFHNDLLGDGVRAGFFALYQQLSARLTVRGAARLCVVSRDHYEASRLRRALAGAPPKVVELPNGVDLQSFQVAPVADDPRARHGIPPTAKLLLFVAALDRAHHFKGLGTLLQAARYLPRDIRLLVVGDGDLRRLYEQQAAHFNLAERVVFAGAIAHDNLPPYFRSADLTILPSSPPESFGLVLIESLACGTPPVASDIPGVRTVVEHGRDGLLVEPRNPLALAEAIVRILRDDGGRREMGRRGRAKVEARYDWQAIGARLEATYLHILGQVELPARPSLHGAR
jgi:glycosyltransferase involved in cell wall biosynthesis